MIYKYEFYAYIENDLMYHSFLKSLNQIARTVDLFVHDDIWFEVYDLINDRSVDVKELMGVYHGEVFD